VAQLDSPDVSAIITGYFVRDTKHSYKNKLHNFGVPERQSYATYFCKDPKQRKADFLHL